MSHRGEPRLSETQRYALTKIGAVRGRVADFTDIAPNISLRALAGRGMVKVHVTLTERGKLVAAQLAVARKIRKPKT
jgi:hypothetical protein